MTAPIGIIGGMGPHAGLDLMRAVLASVTATADQDYPAIALLSYSDRIPDRTAWLAGRELRDPAEAILSVAHDLSLLGVRWAGMACNTAHAPAILGRVRERLPREAPGVTLLDMIGETVAACRLAVPGATRIGLLATLGTYRTGVYADALVAAGLVPVLPTESTREQRVHRAIYDPVFGIKTRPDPVTGEARALLAEAVGELVEMGAQAIILGCTELPLAFSGRSAGPLPTVDPTIALARALVREAAPERLVPLV